jgi:Flp pilus assembly protein TadG
VGLDAGPGDQPHHRRLPPAAIEVKDVNTNSTTAAPMRFVARRVAAVLRSLHREDSGQDLLEFALLTPFVLFFIFVVIDFGVALGESHAVNHAVREAARAGAVGNSETDIRQRAIDQSGGLLSGAGASCPIAAADDACIEVTWNDGPDSNGTAGDAGDAVTVRAIYKHRMLNPFVAWLPFAEIEVGGCADSRVEVEPTSPVDRGWDCSS